MAALAVVDVEPVEEMLRQALAVRPLVAPAPASLQDFLHDNGLLSWMDSDEGRGYVLHVCMTRGRAAR